MFLLIILFLYLSFCMLVLYLCFQGLCGAAGFGILVWTWGAALFGLWIALFVFAGQPLAQLIIGSHGFDNDLCLSLRLQPSS